MKIEMLVTNNTTICHEEIKVSVESRQRIKVTDHTKAVFSLLSKFTGKHFECNICALVILSQYFPLFYEVILPDNRYCSDFGLYFMFQSCIALSNNFVSSNSVSLFNLRGKSIPFSYISPYKTIQEIYEAWIVSNARKFYHWSFKCVVC